MELSPKLIEDYYKNKSVDAICKEAGISRTTFQRLKKKQGLANRRSFLSKIDTGDAQLNTMLQTKYLSIVNRCNGMSTDKYGHYKDLDYMTLQEWVNLCNENKPLLLDLWERYVRLGRKLKHSVSIDRLDTAKGYTSDNIRFVPHGYNSWLRNLYPLRVTHDGVIDYFMSAEESSRFYGLRKSAINDIQRKTKYHLKEYDTAPSTIGEVLAHKGGTLRSYYDKFISESD